MFFTKMADRAFGKHLNTWIFSAFFTQLFIFTGGYNFDVKNVKVFEDPMKYRSSRESYFGFSTALYTSSFNDLAGASVLVGAPRANSSFVPTVLEPGIVYTCPVNGSCVEWNIDPTTNGHVDRNPNLNQIKDNAWIGATIGVENKSQPKIMVCAPRWKNNIVNSNKPNWFMNGICYCSTKDDDHVLDRPMNHRLIPLLGTSLQISSGTLRFYNYGMGQTGFSMDVPANSNASDFILGNPGVYNWKGIPLMTSFTTDGNIYQTIPQIGRESLIHSGDYFGYAVSSGDYFAKNEIWYASGAPRGANMKGRVLIFRFSVYADRRLIVSKVLDGEQHGEYFGASLASCDVNNDGKAEIVVGAPLWSRDMEEGRVYAYVIKNNGDFEPQYLEGGAIGGRFGTTVTCLGDLDHDGYGDIVVGAPYENDHGAIYVYNGNSNGLTTRYSQRIGGKSISNAIRGFGASISQPRDIDGNAYADIAVGAHQSGDVVLLRSQPVVVMAVSIKYENFKELLANSTFFMANVCSYYSGFRVPETLSVLRILKVDPLHGRAFFGDRNNINATFILPATLQWRKRVCDQIRINLENGNQNVIDPIEVSVSLELVNPLAKETLTQPADNLTGNNYCSSCPMVNRLLSHLEDSMSVPFAVDCGLDDICSSILDLSITSDLDAGNRYTLGSQPTMKLTVGVANRGEPAYKTQTQIYIPHPISLGSLPPECMENSRLDGILQVTCELGNPLRDRTTSVVELDMSNIPSNSKEVNIFTNVTTQSVDLNSQQNFRNFTIYFDVDADITIAGKSQDPIHSYFNKEGDTKLDVIRFQHIWEVQKFGKSPIDESSLAVLLPTYWNDEGHGTEIIRISQVFGLMEGRQFFCTDYKNRTDDEETMVVDSLVDQNATISAGASNSRIKNHAMERFSIEETPSSNLPPDSRTIYLNCTNPTVTCTQINCALGTFASSLTVAKLVVTIDLQLKNFRRETMEIKDIVYFVSNGSVSIKQPEGIIQAMDDKPDSVLVSTTFVGSPIAAGIALWIVVLSVLLGILLLILLTLGLVRLGFFHRKKQEDLEALRAESDKTHGFVLETTSSKENLDQD
ncbi:integrin alpha-8-like [Venturia canescens]|uniref:integrin alpha-8-like n=1 Tax=Venturia canescens TaxID=32260 RepID=UPI001C9C5DE5|nr:integrin alpha-8-like [Venturia canescens]